MEDLRRIGELVGGNVEHIRALGNLARVGQWRSVIDFLGQQRLNSSSQISSIRSLLQEYDECEDEVAMKKKYLHLRVRKASMGAKALSREEQLRLLEQKRAELLHSIATRSRRLQELERLKKEQDKCSITTSCVQSQITEIEESRALLSEYCKDISAVDPLITTKDIGAKRSSSLEALVRAYVADTQGEPTAENLLEPFATRRAGDILREIDIQLRDLLERVHQLTLGRAPLKDLSRLRNIQTISLELAKSILLLRRDKSKAEEVMTRLESLKRPIVAEKEPSQAMLDLTEITKLRADNVQSTLIAGESGKSVIKLTLDLLQMDSDLKESFELLTRLSQQLQYKIQKQSNITEACLDDDANEEESDNFTLLKIKCKHTLAASELPDVQGLKEKIQQYDDSLIDEFKVATKAISIHRADAAKRLEEFREECNSLETLQRKDIQFLLNSINQ